MKWVAVSVMALIALVVIIATLMDWNVLRGPVSRMISAKTGHATSIDGNLSVHLWSWNPTLTVEGLHMQGPQWAGDGRMLNVQKGIVQFSLGRLLTGHLMLPRVEIAGAELNLQRDSSGRSSWESPSATHKRAAASPHLPAIHRLIIRDTKIHVEDGIRKLIFDGTLAADEQAHTRDESAFQLNCTGTLNGRGFKLQANGGPLINADTNTPYRFAIRVSAGEMLLDAQATIPKPFDLAEYQAAFTLSGDNLADAYYLTNLALPNTSKYKVEGTLKHKDDEFQVDDFRGQVGSSDIAGDVSVSTAGKRPKMTARLLSKRLNMADLASTLGTGAKLKPGLSATQVAEFKAEGYLFPDADLQVDRVRGMDADVAFQAKSVISGKIPLQHVNFHLLLDGGVLRLDPLSFTLPQGQLAGSVKIDASKDVPETDIDMVLANVDLTQFKPKSAQDPPLEGILSGRTKLHGAGSSVHKFASSADGVVAMVIPRGQIRTLFAELTGIDVVRALGLFLAKDQTQMELRCGVANFQAEQGQLTVKTLVLDTTDVLITGSGNADLGAERLDLSLQGHPKKMRLVRLRSPIRVTGSLLKPHVGIEPGKALLQAGTGTVLAALLTPVAAILAFVDPGRAKDVNCPDLLAQQ
ncbi:MAG: AsmA family protein [Gammaproteobacteria bacterium]